MNKDSMVKKELDQYLSNAAQCFKPVSSKRVTRSKKPSEEGAFCFKTEGIQLVIV
jgi:hypothetical protein